MRYFDTHAHVGLIYDDPIEQLLVCQEAKQVGLGGIVSICNSLVDFKTTYDSLRTADHVYFAVGVSPSEVQNPGKNWQKLVEEYSKLPRVIAVGEMGLDYFHKYGDRKSQIELFIQELEMAQQLNLPAIIHNRDAGKDVLDILRDRLPRRGAVFHCYSEDATYAQKAINLNVYFSFAGNLTYRNARNLHETVEYLPIERILIESEAPFMVPAEYRGKRNKPEYLPATAQVVSEIKGLSIEETCAHLYQNALNFFGLPA